MAKKTLPQIVNDIYGLLEPLESEERQKVVGSVMTLLGEESKLARKGKQTGGESPEEPETGELGVKAGRWMKQNGISMEMLDEIFHIEDGEVEIIASDVPGSGKKGKTTNCYLLAGVQGLLANDEAKFSDKDAVDLCKHLGCHDGRNHAKNRNELGNVVAGAKNNGFTLPAPGLRAAANVIKEMAKES